MNKGDSLAHCIQKNRLNSFKKWIFSDKCSCSAEKLAEAGFHFVGSSNEPDLVQCVFCDKQLDGWEKDDDPWQEHISHSSKCKFASKKTSEENMTLYELYDLQETLVEKFIEDYIDKKIKELDVQLEMVQSQFDKN